MKVSQINFDRIARQSIAVVEDKNISYIGVSELKPEDFSHVSPYFGCSIAELKARRAAFKGRRAEMVKQCRLIEHLLNNCAETKDYNPGESAIRVMKNNIKGLNKQIKGIDEVIETLTNAIQVAIEARETAIRESGQNVTVG